MKFVPKPNDDDSTHLTVGMLLHCLCKNPLRFDKVKERLKVGTFAGHSVSLTFLNANSRTVSLLFLVLDLIYEIN